MTFGRDLIGFSLSLAREGPGQPGTRENVQNLITLPLARADSLWNDFTPSFMIVTPLVGEVKPEETSNRGSPRFP